MKGLNIELEVLYFSTFRKPSSTSLILTYLIPPFTTIRGLISNAMGLSRDDLSLQEKIKIGIAVKEFGFKNVEMAKILKLKEMPGKRTVQFPSSPMFREYIFNPKYDIYLGGDSEIISEIYKALKNPERPLYIGQSDDLVEISLNEPIEIEETESKEIWSIAEGIFPDALVEKVPFMFRKSNGSYTVDYKIMSVFKEYPYSSSKVIKCFRFQLNQVVLI